MRQGSTGWNLLLLTVVLALTACSPNSPKALEKAGWIVVLGAAQYNGVPSGIFRQRLDAAAALYRQGLAPRVLVSGGKKPGDQHSEGEAGRDYLLGLGLPPGALQAETRSRSTFQNLALALPWIRGKRIIVVTDQPHLPRALLLAQRLGLQAQGYAVEGQFSTAYRNRETLLYGLTWLGLRDATALPTTSDGAPEAPVSAP